MRALFLFFLLILFSCSERNIYNTKFLNLKGEEVLIKRGKKTLLVYVWTGTCIGHTEDLKELVKNYDSISRKYRVISVAVFMKPEDVKEFLKENKIKTQFPMLSDPKGNLSDVVKLVFLPSTIIFNEEGKPVKIYPRLPLNVLLENNVSH